MHVMILGTRGVPAKHGGFETFAEDLSLFLVSQQHRVTVYCQAEPNASPKHDEWNGVERILIPAGNGPSGTITYDWKSAKHSASRDGVVLTLGYNTAVFSLLYRLRHLPNVMNMDGIEWARQKWSLPQKCWLWFNEWAGSRLANHLIADHPEIAKHLQRHTDCGKISVIPYGADAVLTAPDGPLRTYRLNRKCYYLLIARPEPENSVLEIVRAFSSRRIGTPLLVLGKFFPERNAYHREVLDAANSNVRFIGTVYDRAVVRALRFHAKGYIHGHRVGGTNPSLVESLAAGNAIITHDNRFNRWVAGKGAGIFKNSDDLEEFIYSLERDSSRLACMEEASYQRHREEFTKEKVLLAYESLLRRFAARQAVEMNEIVEII